MVEKGKTKTIEISTVTYDNLCGIKAFLEETFKVNVSFDRLLRVLYSPKLVDWSEIVQGTLDNKPVVEKEENFENPDSDGVEAHDQ